MDDYWKRHFQEYSLTCYFSFYRFIPATLRLLLPCLRRHTYLRWGLAGRNLQEQKVMLFMFHVGSHVFALGALTWQPISQWKKISCGLLGWWHLNHFNQRARQAKSHVPARSQPLQWCKLSSWPLSGLRVCWKHRYCPTRMDFSFHLCHTAFSWNNLSQMPASPELSLTNVGSLWK